MGKSRAANAPASSPQPLAVDPPQGVPAKPVAALTVLGLILGCVIVIAVFWVAPGSRWHPGLQFAEGGHRSAAPQADAAPPLPDRLALDDESALEALFREASRNDSSWRKGTAEETEAGWTMVRSPSIARSLDAALARKLLNGRTVLFLGDSVMIHGAFVLIHYLSTGRWVLPENKTKPWYEASAPLLVRQYRDVEHAALEYDYHISDCVPDRDMNSRHWMIGASEAHPDHPLPGARLSLSAWRGDFNSSDESSDISGVQACLTDPFNRALRNPGAAARNVSTAVFRACRASFSKERCSEAHAIRTSIPNLSRRLVGEMQPDALILNNGLWYAKYFGGAIPAETSAGLIEVVREAIASRAQTSRPLRVIWKTTTFPWKWSYGFDRKSQAGLEAALEAAGAEIFDEPSYFTQELLATGTDDFAGAGFMDGIHPGSAVNAEIHARLLLHLARGWQVTQASSHK